MKEKKTKVVFEADGRKVTAQPGISVLQACLENGIYIPNLCWLEGMSKPPASCRLCFVQVEGRKRPQTSCTLEVAEGIVVRTDSEEVRELQQTALDMFLSVHHLNCKECPANKKCELQKIAKFLQRGLKPQNLPDLGSEKEVNATHPCLIYDPNRCVLCGRCVYVCAQKSQVQILDFAYRGLRTTVSFWGAGDPEAKNCISCLSCVQTCPVSALTCKA
ncbi:MAG: 2Fe-2S iron-sulfur cluster-binding protein [Desulfovermiculus sp.]